MPDYTVIFKAEYEINADTPRAAIELALQRSNHPDRLTIQAEDPHA